MRNRVAIALSAIVLDVALLAAGLGLSTPAGALTNLTTGGHSVHTIHVTQADSGKHYSIHPGDRVVVKLLGPSSYIWTEPASSRSAVLLRTKGASGSTPTAAFVAGAAGQSKVSATDNPTCFLVCLPPSQVFSIEVKVRK